MKYIILIGDGMGDYPLDVLGGKTPLEAAQTPNLDRLAQVGTLARASTIPEGMEPGSDVANLSLLGYDPAIYHTGRAPLEAASIGVELAPDQLAFRCNLVVLERDDQGREIMSDYASGHITTEQAKPIVDALQAELGSQAFEFHLGTSYRHLLVWTGGPDKIGWVPPHDMSKQVVRPNLDWLKETCPEIFQLVARSWEIMPGKSPEAEKEPNSIWPWGDGRPPAMTTLSERYGIKGAVISAVDLVKGLGVYAGLEIIPVKGATGWLDTNYAGKVEAGLETLKSRDFLYLHVEAPDEAGHTGQAELKVQAIEDFDEKVVGPLVDGLAELGDFRIIIACDHYTPISTMTHSGERVPLILHDSRKPESGPARVYTEAEAAKGPDLSPGHSLTDLLFERE